MSEQVRLLTHERDRLRLLLEVNNAVVAHLDLQHLLYAISAYYSATQRAGRRHPPACSFLRAEVQKWID